MLDSSDQEDETLARIDQFIAEGEQRILRVRHAVAKLDAKGFDTSAGKDVLATMTRSVENLRAHRRMAVSRAWRRLFR